MEKRSNSILKKSSANQNEVRITPSGVAVKSFNRELVRNELKKLVKPALGQSAERTEHSSSNN